MERIIGGNVMQQLFNRLKRMVNEFSSDIPSATDDLAFNFSALRLFYSAINA